MGRHKLNHTPKELRLHQEAVDRLIDLAVKRREAERELREYAGLPALDSPFKPPSFTGCSIGGPSGTVGRVATLRTEHPSYNFQAKVDRG